MNQAFLIIRTVFLSSSQTTKQKHPFDMEIIFHSHSNQSHFHKKGCARSFILKVRGFGTRKWPIDFYYPAANRTERHSVAFNNNNDNKLFVPFMSVLV